MRHFILLLLVFLIGCTPFPNLQNISNESHYNDDIQNTTPHKIVVTDEELIGINSSSLTCKQDSDCTLYYDVGCYTCFPCGEVKITESQAYAVNKNFTSKPCPPHPTNVVCVACAGYVSFPENIKAVCVDNKCKKTKTSFI